MAETQLWILYCVGSVANSCRFSIVNDARERRGMEKASALFDVCHITGCIIVLDMILMVGKVRRS